MKFLCRQLRSRSCLFFHSPLIFLPKRKSDLSFHIYLNQTDCKKIFAFLSLRMYVQQHTKAAKQPVREHNSEHLRYKKHIKFL